MKNSDFRGDGWVEGKVEGPYEIVEPDNIKDDRYKKKHLINITIAFESYAVIFIRCYLYLSSYNLF